MRRLILLLCLLVVAALLQLFGSVGMRTIMQDNDAVLPWMQVGVEAVNTGFQAPLLAPDVCAANVANTAFIARDLSSQTIGAGLFGRDAFPSGSNLEVELGCIPIGTGRTIEGLPPAGDRV